MGSISQSTNRFPSKFHFKFVGMSNGRRLSGYSELRIVSIRIVPTDSSSWPPKRIIRSLFYKIEQRLVNAYISI